MSEREPLGWLGTYTAVSVGAFIAIGAFSALQYASEKDIDPGTYEPSDLTVVEFRPEPGVECRGLSPSGAEQVLAATVVCDWSSVESTQP